MLADFFGDLWQLDTLSGTFRMATPLLLAALGGLYCERAGVINIALEGIMLNGAFAGVSCAYLASGVWGFPLIACFWLGLLGSVLAGVLTSFIHAVVSVTVKADQIISGVAINILALGLTQFLCQVFFESASNSPSIKAFALKPAYYHLKPVLVDLLGERAAAAPFLKDFLLSFTLLVYIGWALLIVGHLVLFRTVFGLRLRSVGEHPEAADTLGIRVQRMRYVAVLISGALAGLAGAYLTIDSASFVQGMTNGRGYIAIAAYIFGRWTPLGAFGACLLFGFALKVSDVAQAEWPDFRYFAQVIPHIATIVVLAGFVGRARPPAAIGKPYEGG